MKRRLDFSDFERPAEAEHSAVLRMRHNGTSAETKYWLLSKKLDLSGPFLLLFVNTAMGAGSTDANHFLNFTSFATEKSFWLAAVFAFARGCPF